MKVTIATITPIQTTITIQKISRKSQSILGPKVEMSWGTTGARASDASPFGRAREKLRMQSPGRSCRRAACCGRYAIHGLGVIMLIGNTIINDWRNEKSSLALTIQA